MRILDATLTKRRERQLFDLAGGSTMQNDVTPQ
jgi:hypothetical protein